MRAHQRRGTKGKRRSDDIEKEKNQKEKSLKGIIMIMIILSFLLVPLVAYRYYYYYYFIFPQSYVCLCFHNKDFFTNLPVCVFVREVDAIIYLYIIRYHLLIYLYLFYFLTLLLRLNIIVVIIPFTDCPFIFLIYFYDTTSHPRAIRFSMKHVYINIHARFIFLFILCVMTFIFFGCVYNQNRTNTTNK